jgi:hypothetical protein
MVDIAYSRSLSGLLLAARQTKEVIMMDGRAFWTVARPCFKTKNTLLRVKARQTRIERPNHVSAKGVLLYVEKYCTTSIYKKPDDG